MKSDGLLDWTLNCIVKYVWVAQWLIGGINVSYALYMLHLVATVQYFLD